MSDRIRTHDSSKGCVGCPLFDGGGPCNAPWCNVGGEESDFYDPNPRCPLLKGDVIIKRKG